MCNCKNQPVNTSSVECAYTLEQLQNWRELLLCVRQNGLYEQAQTTPNEISSALGITLSAYNYGSNLCYYKKYLDALVPLIHRIISIEQCQ